MRLHRSFCRKGALTKVVMYRRVSSRKQEKSEYRNQLNEMKARIPGLRVSDPNVIDIKECTSGRSDAKSRMAGGLGSALRHLMRDPTAIMIVSDADRIARTEDIFMLISKQGLGKQVIDVSTGMNVDEIIDAKKHTKIQRDTERLQSARRAGVARYRSEGGTLGNTEIGKQSPKATEILMEQTEARRRDVLKVVEQLVLQNRGKRPTLGQVCDELDRHEIRAGQGNKFEQSHLSQLKKAMPDRWAKAEDIYQARRRRIRMIVKLALVPAKRRREPNWRRKCLDVLGGTRPFVENLRQARRNALTSNFARPYPTRVKRRGEDGCRSPPYDGQVEPCISPGATRRDAMRMTPGIVTKTTDGRCSIGLRMG